MTKKERAVQAVERLKQAYPGAVCSLESTDAFQLLVAVRLSAQCTDARVNLVTPALFARYPTIDDFCEADQAEVEDYIRSCGFFRDKAKSIIGMARMVRDEFGGVVPDNIEDLTKLPGVGRKTANLICGDVYGKPAVVVDTHCIRISNRIGLVNNKVPEKIETELRKLLPPEESNDFCHRLVLHGRAVCSARKARCGECVLDEICKKVGVTQ
ncbi:MAG: endonuclease III [Clostridiales bacterium]|nr:endonuclease III [Clostridiales bacterium]